MKNKILVSTILLMILLLPLSVFGAYSYERTPSGYEITSPVSLEISFDDYVADLLLNASTTYWGVKLNLDFCGVECPDSIFTYCLPVSTLSNTFVIDVPLDYGVDDIYAIGDISEVLCEGGDPTYDGLMFEESSGFTIVPPPPPVRPLVASFEDMPENTIASTTAYIGDLFGTFGVFVWLAIGIPLGFYIINSAIDLFTKGKKIRIKK